MKHTNEAVTRRFMKKLRKNLLEMSDREFQVMSTSLTDMVYEVSEERRIELAEWTKAKVEKLDLRPAIVPRSEVDSDGEF